MDKSKKDFLAPGHRACPGCGSAIIGKLVVRALGENTIVVSASGCLETFTTTYGISAWDVPFVHCLFENSASVATGIAAALEALGEDVNLVVMSGDGGTYDIGIGSLSGMLERGDNVTYICYDNEAYMNTGVQRSGATPLAASTMTTPVGKNSFGKPERKKDMTAIALAHGAVYVATASIAYPQGLMNKVKKANSMRGPKYIQIHAPCCVGWGFDPSKTIEIARLSVETGSIPLFEIVQGEPMKVRKLTKKRPVEDYLKEQQRFKHLFVPEKNEKLIQTMQQYCDDNIARFGL
jgi:pyruvate ferredoxin oxidoreductase beta subunit